MEPNTKSLTHDCPICFQVKFRLIRVFPILVLHLAELDK